MTKYLALLRGINVGGKKKVEMKKLKTVLEDLGLSEVRTYINSGNVIFESEERVVKLVPLIEQALAKAFAFEIRIVLRDQKNIQTVASVIPKAWANDTEQKTDVLFVWEDFDSPDSLKLLAPVVGVDELIYTKGAIVWHIKRSGYNRSAMRKFIGTPLYKNMTARNVNTLRKLVALMGE